LRKGTFLCIGWLPILLCSLALLLVTALFEWRDIEQKVEASAKQALSSDEFSWAKVKTYNRGRQVLITGAAPNQAAIQQAEDLVGQAYGVFSAKHNGEPLAARPLSPASLLIRSQNGKIELRGSLANQTEIDRVMAIAVSTFGVGSVININAKLTDKRLMLSGTVPSANVLAKLNNDIRKMFNGDIRNQISVVPPRNICQELVDDLLSRGKVNYETASATISDSSFNLLDQIAKTAEQCPNANFEISGHTDSAGSLSFNTRLSQARAQAVVDYLVSKGLNTARFTAKGYGPSKPIADNSTAEGRAINRRIEFKLSN